MSAAFFPSTCPHDCPSACSLKVEVLPNNRIGRVRGNEAQSYTSGVICAKVARYAERLYHPDRLLTPLRRTGPKGSRQFQRISWEEAFERITERFLAVEAEHGASSLWPYYYAGTMGQLMRDGINRLTHAKRYSGLFTSICTTLAWGGVSRGHGAALRGGSA